MSAISADPPPMLALNNPNPARRYGLGFWAVAFAFTALMAFTTVPTPLWSLFARRDGFSSLTITFAFAAYAVAVAISLVLAGHLSDVYGRRRLLVPAIGAERGRGTGVRGVARAARSARRPGAERPRHRCRDRDGNGVAGGTRGQALPAGRQSPSADHQHRRQPRRTGSRRTDRWCPRPVGRPRPHDSVPCAQSAPC